MTRVDREQLTRQIRDAVDIVDLVGSYLTLKRAGANFKACCPFHEEKTPSFNVSPSKQTFKCFGCGAGGDSFTFLQLRERVDFLEARRMLADRAGVSLEVEEKSGGAAGGFSKSGFTKSDLARANSWAQKVFRRNFEGEAGENARQYVEKRSISGEFSQKFGLGLAVDSFDSLLRQAEQNHVDLKLLAAAGLVKERQSGGYYDTFRDRLMFPISDQGGRIIGFGGRTLGDDVAKYLNTPTTPLFDKSASLFGLDQARQGMAERGRAVVVEGYTDCIMAHQHGFTETIATLGTAMTEQHAKLLRRQTEQVILLFDSDEAGQRAADRALAVTLSEGLDVSLARVPTGKDPCDYLLSAGPVAFENLLKDATGALEFKWQGVLASFQTSDTGPSRRRAIEEYLQQLAEWIGRGVIDSIQTGLLVNQLSKILSLPTEELHRQLKSRALKARAGFSGQASRERTSESGSSSRDDDVADDSIGRSVPGNAAQRAYREMIEVLLNAPENYPAVAGVLEPALIDDPALSSIATVLKEMLDACQPFRLDALVGRFESPGYARLITDLQYQGERRGGYRGTIRGALDCLKQYPQVRQAAQCAESIRSDGNRSSPNEAMEGQGVDAQGEDDRLQALAAGVKVSHFATMRARKRYLQE